MKKLILRFRTPSITIGFLLCATLIVILTRCASAGGPLILPESWDVGQGQQFAGQIEHQMKVMHDPMLDRYISNLGHRMVTQGVPDAHFEFQFHVVDSDQVNAFAIPGGNLYVNLALLKEAASEAELVGVIGHEMGHVIHRHGAKQMQDAMGVQVATMTAAEIVAHNQGEGWGQATGIAGSLFGQGGLLYYGRKAELEADRTGEQILDGTGYDVQALPRFFEKLIKIEQQHGGAPSGLAQLLSTHPPTQDRIDKCEEFIATLPPQKNPKINSPEFDEMKRHIAPMVPSKSK